MQTNPLDVSLSSPFRLASTAEFIPKFLDRREKARSTTAPRSAAPAAAVAATAETLPKSAKLAPPAFANLPRSFHKRYLMNFTVLSPEQQRAAQDAERIERQKEAEDMRGIGGGGGWRGHRGGSSGWGGAAASHGPGRAALRGLARRGVLEREEVQAMLRPGPLQDFRGSVLQVTSPDWCVDSEGVGIAAAVVGWRCFDVAQQFRWANVKHA